MSIRPTETWSTDGLPSGARADLWHDVLAETHLRFDTVVPVAQRPTFTAEVTRRRFGELALIDCEVDPCTGHRGRQELAVDPGWAGVLVIGAGRERVRQAGREMLLGPGDCVMWDGERPVDFEVLEPLRKRTLLLPRERVLGLGGDIPKHVPAGSAHSRLLSGYLDMLSRELDHLDGPACAAAANAALELLRAVVALQPGGDLRTVLLPQIRRWIEARLHDPGLSPTDIAAANAVSVRTLHALFASTDETVGEFVKRRRLTRARDDLLEHPDVTITRVAVRWGFTNAAHFSRSFRAEFGVSPRELRHDTHASEGALT